MLPLHMSKFHKLLLGEDGWVKKGLCELGSGSAVGEEGVGDGCWVQLGKVFAWLRFWHGAVVEEDLVTPVMM